jgi:hypothetical protein
MLAKIAHAHAIAERGIYAFKPLVAGLIAGDDNAPTHYIGSFRHNLPAEPEYLHRIQLVECINDKVPNTKFLVAVIRLFANSGAPECCVVVGNL